VRIVVGNVFISLSLTVKLIHKHGSPFSQKAPRCMGEINIPPPPSPRREVNRGSYIF
jgi:hypothetical protein